MSRFSTEEDDMLITFVQNHTILYDMKGAEFKNTEKKDRIWNEVGKLMQKEGKECKKRWKSIRDHYKKGKKEEKGTAGKSAKKKRAVYWKRLQFLDTVEDGRSSSANVLTPSDNEASAEQPDIEVLHEYGEDDPQIRPRSPQLRQNAPPTSQIKRTSTRSQHDSSVFGPLASKTSKERLAIEKYLDERKEDRVYFKRHLEDLARQPLPQENENEIDLFFKAMAATVKKFRPDLATRAKASVFKAVTEMELLNQQPPFPRTTGITNIEYNESMENQSDYSSSTSSP